jgi:hypothetical protein
MANLTAIEWTDATENCILIYCISWDRTIPLGTSDATDSRTCCERCLKVAAFRVRRPAGARSH